MDQVNTSLHAVQTGELSPKLATVVFLHGFGGECGDWRDICRAIAGPSGAERPTLAYDLPGHGGSLLAAGTGGAGRMAKAVLADIETRGIGHIHLVGHSMGGAVAALMAMRAPRQVASLTLLAPGGFGPEINLPLLARYAEARTRETLLAALEQMFGWNRDVPQLLLDQRLLARNMPGAVDALKLILPAMTTGEGLERRQGTLPREDLAALRMPVKVLWGTQDRVLPTRQAHKLPPMFATHVFEETGHMLIEEQEEAVIALIRQNIRAGS